MSEKKEVKKAAGFASFFADFAGLSRYDQNGQSFSSILFMKNESTPMYTVGEKEGDEFQVAVHVQSQHVASVTMTEQQMKALYEVLKTHYGDETPPSKD